MCGNKKKSLGAKSELCCGWPINSTFYRTKTSWLDRCARTRIAIVNKDSPFPVRFSNSFKEIVAQVEQFFTWPVFPDKQATICFEVVFPQATLNLGIREHMVDCCFVSASYAWIHYLSYKRFVKHSHRLFSHFNAPIDESLL